MYIQPNSIAVLLTGVPLDESYDHTIKFASETAQRNYFLSKELMRVHPQTYQRHSENVIRVEALADNLYHVNYLMFQNTSFGNKWFYAFVKRVEYINNKTTELVYEIDVYQTWLFEMQVGQCFVEREHIVTDTFGANLMDEDLYIGDHRIVDTKNLPEEVNFEDRFYGVIALSNDDTIKAEVDRIWNDANLGFVIDPRTTTDTVISGGCFYYVFPLTTGGRLMLFAAVRQLSMMPSGLDAIISIFLLPKAPLDFYHNHRDPIYEQKFPMPLPDTYDLGYTPKNKKLFQFPYCFLEASDNAGSSLIYKYEYFDLTRETAGNNKVRFQYGCTISPSSEMYLIPMYYNDTPASELPNVDSAFDSMLISSGIPRIPYSADGYAIWLAQNSTWYNGHRVYGSEIISPKKAVNAMVTGGVMATAVSAKTAGIVGPIGAGALGLGAGALTGFNAVYDGVTSNEMAKMLPDKFNAGTGGVNLLFNKLGYTIYAKAIRPEMLQRIDSFFEMYGYKTNELKVPNMDSRPHWNFVKTAWANINGNIPADDIVKLKNIFNNGITFWKNPSEVGNYTLNNH